MSLKTLGHGATTYCWREQGEHRYKVGSTGDLHKRMKTSQTTNADPIEVICCITLAETDTLYTRDYYYLVEKAAHQFFNEFHHRAEFFSLGDDPVSHFKKFVAHFNITTDIKIELKTSNFDEISIKHVVSDTDDGHCFNFYILK